MAESLQVTEHITIPESELWFTAARSSGAGGQNVNKVASKVELHFALWSSRVLSPAVKQRLAALREARFDQDGQLVVTSQLTRDQSRNLADARGRLCEMILRALVVPKVRRATKPTHGSRKRRLTAKRQQAQKKRDRFTTDD